MDKWQPGDIGISGDAFHKTGVTTLEELHYMYSLLLTDGGEFEVRCNIIRRKLERLEKAEQELFSRYEKIMKLRDALQRLYDAVEADDGVADWHMKRAESALAETEMENDDD